MSSNRKPFVPRNGWIMIRVIDEVDQDGVQVPKKYRQQNNKGEVVSVPSDCHDYRVGDWVLFGQYNSEKFTKDGEEFELVRTTDIRGVESCVYE